MAYAAGRRPRATAHRRRGGVEFGRKLFTHERLPAVSSCQTAQHDRWHPRGVL